MSPPRQSLRYPRSRRFTTLGNCLLLLSLFTFHARIFPCYSHALEAKWTPNDKDDTGGPLPLSQQRREQLTQLEHAIRNSPDPQGTLVAAAKSIDMDPQELLNLLERNHRDTQVAMMEARKPKLTQNILRAITASTLSLVHWSRKHPQRATMCATLLLATLYILQTAPKSGTVLSMTRRSLLSNGPTTLLAPPVKFVRQAMLSELNTRRNIVNSILNKWSMDDWEDIIDDLPHMESDGSTWLKLKKSKKGKTLSLQQAAVSQATVHLDVQADNHEEEEDHESYIHEEVAWEQAALMLQTLSLTERATDPAVRFVASTKESYSHKQKRQYPKFSSGVLVVKGLGDYGRYALVGLEVTDCHLDHESAESDNELSLSMNTWANNHFDGRIHVSVTRSTAQTNELVVHVFLIVPKGGVRISKKAALSVVDTLSHSIAESIRIRTQQTIIRRQQSSSFSKSARKQAQSRRKTRQAKEQLMEEMASDRRRRWQRGNPNAGHYRPSGKRQQSPNNAMYY